MQVPMEECPNCQAQSEMRVPPMRYAARYTCPRCGTFDWQDSAPLSGRAERLTRFAAYVRSQNQLGNIPLFDKKMIGFVEQQEVPSLTDRAERILLYLARTATHTSFENKTKDLELQATAYAKAWSDLLLPLEILADQGLSS